MHQFRTKCTNQGSASFNNHSCTAWPPDPGLKTLRPLRPCAVLIRPGFSHLSYSNPLLCPPALPPPPVPPLLRRTWASAMDSSFPLLRRAWASVMLSVCRCTRSLAAAMDSSADNLAARPYDAPLCSQQHTARRASVTPALYYGNQQTALRLCACVCMFASCMPSPCQSVSQSASESVIGSVSQ